ncbi:hypothetical protein HMPREF0185_00006 [Brevundimonas diminuta 470-4]|nr:hypothetical protein HMPREF0185_00006 [Brevundimonas diminuta 470-4]
MVEDDAKTGSVVLNGAAHKTLGHDDRHSNSLVLRARRLDEQPLGRGEPLVRTDDAVQIIFEFSAVDFTFGVLLKANGKASQWFFDRLQYASIYCEAWMVS